MQDVFHALIDDFVITYAHELEPSALVEAIGRMYLSPDESLP